MTQKRLIATVKEKRDEEGNWGLHPEEKKLLGPLPLGRQKTLFWKMGRVAVIIGFCALKEN